MADNQIIRSDTQPVAPDQPKPDLVDAQGRPIGGVAEDASNDEEPPRSSNPNGERSSSWAAVAGAGILIILAAW